MKTRACLAAGAALALALSLAVAGAEAQVLRVGLQSDIDTLDPVQGGVDRPRGMVEVGPR